jgi:hypothetical protein
MKMGKDCSAVVHGSGGYSQGMNVRWWEKKGALEKKDVKTTEGAEGLGEA